MNHLINQTTSEGLLVWQRPEWPYFQWDSSALLDSLVKVRHEQGRLLALAQNLTLDKRAETELSDLQKDILLHSKEPLTKERICGWQASLFPTGFSGIHRICVGEYRKKDQLLRSNQIVPPAKSLSDSMKKMLTWWNESPVGLDGIIRAGIAYFWFMTLSPFEDGNSQVALSLVDLALAQDEKRGRRAYSLNKTFEANQNSLEQILQTCFKQNGDITLWLNWFFEKLLEVIQAHFEGYENKAKKVFFIEKLDQFQLNYRQKKIVHYFLAAENKAVAITNRKCVELCQSSRESIKRDLKKLVEFGIIQNTKSNGRSVSYHIILEKDLK